MSGARFDLGRVVATPAALALAERHNVDISALMRRHVAGDWGDVDAEDRGTNEQAVKDGSRILSVYTITEPAGENVRATVGELWIITDAAIDVCPACWAGIGECEPDKGEWHSGTHFRTDQPLRRITTTVLLPDDY